MNIAIIMPTLRWANWPRVRANLEAARSPAAQLVWLPVMYHHIRDELTPAQLAPLRADWIHPLVLHDEPGVNPIYHKFNAGLNRLAAEDFDGWFYFGADDDLIPAAFGRKFSQGRPHGVIVASAKRGQRVTDKGYPTTDLVAAPENMRVGCVTAGQALLHLRLLHRRRYRHHDCADGMMLEVLYKSAPEEFCFLPDFFLPFNALEPGRWDEDKLNELLNAN